MTDDEVTMIVNINPKLRKEIIHMAADKGISVDKYLIEAVTERLNHDKAVLFAEQTVGRGKVTPEEAAEVLREFIAASDKQDDN